MAWREDRERYDAFGLELPFVDLGAMPGKARRATPGWEQEEPAAPAAGEDPAGLAAMLAIRGRFGDPARDPAIDVDGARFDRFLRGKSRRAFARDWLAGSKPLAEAAAEPKAELQAGDIDKAWFVIHDWGSTGKLTDKRFKAANTKGKSVHGFVNRGGYYGATYDFARNKSGTVYEFLSRKGVEVAGGKTVNLETVPDIEDVPVRADGGFAAASNPDLYASIGYRRLNKRTIRHYKYTHGAFDTLADLYILASARAGHLLTITAHKEMDRNLGRSVIWREVSAAKLREAKDRYFTKARDNPGDYHGDPYAFDMQALYDVITRKLNALGGAQMPPRARYGIHPLRVRKADGQDITNGSSHLHTFPWQSDPQVKIDTRLKKPGWWNSGAKSEAEAGEAEAFAWGQEGFDEAELEDSHEFEDEDAFAAAREAMSYEGFGEGEEEDTHEFEDEDVFAAAREAMANEGYDEAEDEDGENLAWLDLETEAFAPYSLANEVEAEVPGEGLAWRDEASELEGFAEFAFEESFDAQGGSQPFSAEDAEQPGFAEDEGPVIDGEAPLWRLGNGFSKAPVAGGEVVGIVRDNGPVLVAVDRSGKRPVALSAARVGTLEIGPGRPLFRCREMTLASATGGATGELRGAPTGPVRFVLENGVELLRVDGRTVVGAPASSLPPVLFALAGLSHGTRIALDGLPHVVWMTFRLRDEAAERSRWVPAKATRKIIDDRRATFDAAARRLSAGDRALVEPYLDPMAVVSVIEGGFGSRSGAGDTHASLGIFQWAMARSQSAETGSLGKFFATLKARAAGGDPLHARAWGECVAKGLDIRDGDRVFTLGGAIATGAQVEAALAGAMAGEALSSYQLRAGVDWIEEFRNTPITPGPLGKEFLGHGWRASGAGRARLTVTSGGVSRVLEVALPAAATIGQAFASPATLTTAVMLGVNRPAYVRLSLWRALAGSADPRTVVARLLDEIFAACAAAGQAPRPGKPFTEVQVNASGAAGQRAYRELQRYLAPPATLPAGGEPGLRAAFESKALLLYKPSDARKYRREGRFATVRVRFP